MGDLSTQIHHVIPINIFNDFAIQFQDIFKKGNLNVNLGEIIQSYNNRMALFTEEGPASALRKLYREGGLADAPLGATKHKGSHPNYDKAIHGIIDGIVKNESLTNPQKRTMLIDMQFSLREMLQSGHPPINADEAVISREIKSKMASADEILSGKGDNYKRALEREARYDANNRKYPGLMKDSIATDAAGKFTNGASNDNFVKATGHEIANALLEADKKAAAENKAAGKKDEGFLKKKNRIALEDVVSGKRKDNNMIRDAISRGVYDYDKSLPARRTSIAGFRNQRGFIDFSVFTDGTIKAGTKAGTLSYGVARDVWHTMSRSNLMAQNIMVPDGKGGLRFNPTLAEGKFGTFLKDKFWGGKVGLAASAAVFLDQTFNGLIKGIETGDWQDFQDAVIKYGVDAVETALGFVIATEAIGVTAALAGDTVIGAGIVLAGEVALAGMMLLGAFAVGWSIGSLLRKGWNWLTGNHEDWDNLPRKNGIVIYDPLTLDLDGDGIEAIASNGHKGALFDHDKDGIRTATGWVGKDDGFLVYDRNGDGVVNDGSELFGDNTLLKNGERATNGYQALADLDDNGDGKVDAADSAFAKLRVWRDLNQDGISQEGELLTLNEAKVKALNLANQSSNRDLGNGNSLAEEGTYTDSDGNEKQMGDLNLAADHFHSRFSDSVPLTDEQQQAPNLRGSGRVRDLREAAAQSPDVAAALQAYANAQTKEEQLALRDQLLRAWAGTDKRFTTEGVLAAAAQKEVMGSSKNAVHLRPGEAKDLGLLIGGPDIWTLLGIEDPEKKKKAALREKIAILDAFTGTDSSHLYYGTKLQAQHIIDTIEKTYANLADNLYDGLLFQTRLKPYLNAIRFGMNEEGKLQLDYSGVAALFDEVHAKNPGKAFTDLGELLAKGNADGSNTDLAPLAEKFVQYAQEASNNGTFEAYSNSLGKESLAVLGHSLGTDNDDTLRGNNGANYLVGNKGNDVLEGYGGDDTLNGGAGNDALFGGAGHDTLDGGAGDDHMEGGNFESDTYIFRAGHGKDTVADLAYRDEETDTLRFEGAQSGNVAFSREGYDLIVRAYGSSNDQVRLKDYFFQWHRDRYYFQFEDNKLGREDIVKKAFDFNATENDDHMEGWESDDTMHGGAGNDTLWAHNGNDTVYGDAGNDSLGGGNGNDSLHGGEGDDTLSGDDGDDTLNGDAGNDTLFGRAGHDTLDGGAGDDHMEGGNFESDTYIFRVGHGKDTVADLAYRDEETDTLRFEGAQSGNAAFSREGYDLIVRAYGSSNDQVTLKNYFFQWNRDRYYFQFEDNKLGREDIVKKAFDFNATDNDDHMEGWESDDTMHGGAGNDTLWAHNGNDTVYGDAGNDSLGGGNGNDSLHGGEGDDTLSGDDGDDTLNGDAGNDTLLGRAGHDTLDGGAGDDHLEGGDFESDTYIFRAGHGKDTVADLAYRDEETDTLRFAGAKAADARFSREGNNLVVNAYGENDRVALKDYFYNDNYSRYDFHFDDATFKAAELRGKDLPTEGLKAPVDATTQTADTQTKTTVPVEENAPPENSAPTASTTTDDKKAETNAQKPIVASDPARPAPQKVIAETAGNTPQANADADVASGDSTAAADTPANIAAAETAQSTGSGATDSAAKNATTTEKPATALVPVATSTKIQPATVAADTQQTPAATASASGDSPATASQKASPATAQQNATAVADALKTGGTTAAAASALDANAARQSQQMLSAMAAQGQTASPTALAAPDLQPKPQLVASQV